MEHKTEMIEETLVDGKRTVEATRMELESTNGVITKEEVESFKVEEDLHPPVTGTNCL